MEQLNEQLFLNIAMSLGMLPLVTGLIAAWLSPEIQGKLIGARQWVTVAVIVFSAILSLSAGLIYGSTQEWAINLNLSVTLIVLWLERLDYFKKPSRNQRLGGYENEMVSLYRALFGYETLPRIIFTAVMIIGWMVFLSVAKPPTWISLVSGAVVLSWFWIAEDLKVFPKR